MTLTPPELRALHRACMSELEWARWRQDFPGQRRLLIWLAVIERAQGFARGRERFGRRWSILYELYLLRDYARIERSLEKWRAEKAKGAA